MALIAIDEFALQRTPDTHYAWAVKNTQPKVASDERHREKLNGFMAVDVQRGTTQVQFDEHSDSETVAEWIVLTLLIYLQKGLTHLTVLLDNASTHQKRMKEQVIAWLKELESEVQMPSFTLEFWHVPKYSPELNPAEYVIHLIRQTSLYHLPCDLTLQNKVERVQTHLAQKSPMTDQQMKNLIDFIARYKVKRL